jgi:3-hydroxybutyrate dehydrogenase
MGVLEGYTVVVTGGTAGIGRSCAEAMLAAGAEAVVINGRSRESRTRQPVRLGANCGLMPSAATS